MTSLSAVVYSLPVPKSKFYTEEAPCVKTFSKSDLAGAIFFEQRTDALILPILKFTGTPCTKMMFLTGSPGPKRLAASTI
jgi:hypothetical protein